MFQTLKETGCRITLSSIERMKSKQQQEPVIKQYRILLIGKAKWMILLDGAWGSLKLRRNQNTNQRIRNQTYKNPKYHGGLREEYKQRVLTKHPKLIGQLKKITSRI
jgi:hypothetical protein